MSVPTRYFASNPKLKTTGRSPRPLTQKIPAVAYMPGDRSSALAPDSGNLISAATRDPPPPRDNCTLSPGFQIFTTPKANSDTEALALTFSGGIQKIGGQKPVGRNSFSPSFDPFIPG